MYIEKDAEERRGRTLILIYIYIYTHIYIETHSWSDGPGLLSNCQKRPKNIENHCKQIIHVARININRLKNQARTVFIRFLFFGLEKSQSYKSVFRLRFVAKRDKRVCFALSFHTHTYIYIYIIIRVSLSLAPGARRRCVPVEPSESRETPPPIAAIYNDLNENVCETHNSVSKHREERRARTLIDIYIYIYKSKREGATSQDFY